MTENILNLIGREELLFVDDVFTNSEALLKAVAKSFYLVIGGAGSIGQAVTIEQNDFKSVPPPTKLTR